MANDGKKRGVRGVIFLTLFLDLVGFSIIFPLYPSMLGFYLEQDGQAGLLGSLLEALHTLSGTSPGADGQPNPQVIALFGGVLGSLYSVLQFVFSPFWGSVSDRVGRRPVLVITIGGIAASYLLWIFSGSFMLLILARIIGGVMSGNIGAATAAMADSTTTADRAKGMGMVGAAFGLGFVVGPAMGGILGLIDLSERFPELRSLGINPFSVPAAGALLLSVINLVWVRRRLHETLPEDHRSKAREAGRSINPARLLQPLDLPGANRANYTNFLFIFAFSGAEFSLTFLAHDRFGYGIAGNALLLSFAGLTMAFIQGGLIRRLAPRLGEVRLARGGLLLLVPGLLLAALAQTEVVLYGGVFLIACGSAAVIPALRALVSLYTPEHRQGEVLGVFNSLGALARAGGPLVWAVVYWRFGAAASYEAGAVFLVLPLILTLGLHQPSKTA